MADNDQQNDEYQFADIDTGTLPTEGESDATTAGTEFQSEISKKPTGIANVKRNSLIVIVLLVVFIGLYKIINSVRSTKVINPPPPPLILPKPAPAPVIKPVVEAPPLPAAPSSEVNNMAEKLGTLENGQDNLRSDISSVNSQLGNINNSLNSMATKMAELNSAIADLNSKLAEESKQIEELTIKHRKKSPPRKHKAVHYQTYYIQALIPGRAWLIAKNGSTITVREGSVIPGYGVVKLIDPEDGRILTGSGRIIKFSKEDS